MKNKFLKMAVAGLVLSVSGVANAGLIIGVDIEAGNNSPLNWSSYGIGDVNSAMTNLIAEDGSFTTASFRLDGNFGTQNISCGASFIPIHSTDLSSICGDVFGGGPNPTIALWEGLDAGSLYNYWVFTSSSADDTITVRGLDTDVFLSPNVAASEQAINGVFGNSMLTFSSYARQITASAMGTIQVEISSTGTPTPSGYAIEKVVIDAPEPSTLTILGLGLMGLAARRFKKQA